MNYDKKRFNYFPIGFLKKLKIGEIMVKNIENLINISNSK